MGLDVTAYSHLRPIGTHVVGHSWCEVEEHVVAYAYECFPQSFRGIPVLGRDSLTEGPRFVYGGCFERTAETEAHSFRAGSYGGYGAWREDLRTQFNPDHDPLGPFYELTYFADNEGTIGPEAAADLFEDFVTYWPLYRPPGPDYLQDTRYTDWMRAFELGREGGLVALH